ncbi:hypothetical protein AADZ91_11255 [Colwelliaceae bacterium 6441]
MPLFSWFTRTKKVQAAMLKADHIDEKITSFNASTMWPTAQVRRNIIVSQQQMTDARYKNQQTIAKANTNKNQLNS